MKNFKRIVVVMAIFLSLVLFACGKKTSKENTTNKPTTDKIPTTDKKPTTDVGPSKDVYTLTVINENRDSGSITEYDHNEFNKGDSVSITATPNDGYVFLGWYENGIFLSDELTFTITFTIPGDEIITAKWDVDPSYCSLTTTNSNSSAGTITNYTKHAFSNNTLIKLLATPNTGYEFDGWYNGDTKLSSNSNYEFYITSNLTITA